MSGRIVTGVLLAGACAVAGPAVAQPPGATSVWFKADRAAVVEGLAGLCSALNATVDTRSNGYVTCTRDASRSEGIAVQAGGNAYSTAPNHVLQFALSDDRAAVRVDAMQYIAVRSAHLTRPPVQPPVLHPKQRRALIAALVALGGDVRRPAKS